MVSKQKKRKNAGRYQKKKSRSSGCLFKGLIVFAVIVILSAIVLALCTSLVSDTKENLERTVYQKEYTECVEKYSKEYGVDENLVYAVINTESDYNPDAVSYVGAVGLMQVMPDTFQWLLEKQGRESEFSGEDLYDPDVNIEFGTYYLSILLNHYEAESSAVAAYNAGFVVDSWLEDSSYSSDGVNLDYIPYDETANYVNKVQYAKSKYESLY